MIGDTMKHELNQNILQHLVGLCGKIKILINPNDPTQHKTVEMGFWVEPDKRQFQANFKRKNHLSFFIFNPNC